MRFEDMDAQERRDYNLEYIAKLPGDYATLLQNYTPKTRLEIKDDNPEVYLGDKPFFDYEYKTLCEKQIDEIGSFSRRLYISAMQPAAFDEEACHFLDYVLREGIENDIKYYATPQNDESYFVTCFGVALGLFLPDLMRKTECGMLILIEPNLELIYHSLEVCDWGEVFKVAKELDMGIRLIVSSDAEAISRDMQSIVRSENYPRVDGMLMFKHYSNPVLVRVEQMFFDSSRNILQGLGFFYDETLMLKNNIYNLLGENARLYCRPKRNSIQTPIFVIGSGPSIDNDLEFIKENQDKVIIISCGSAIRPLLHNGIKPDFQIELENIEVNPLIKQVAEAYDLSDICLITSSTVDTEIIKHFKTVVYYFRASLSPYPIFSNDLDTCLLNSSPTVVNAGVSFAQEIGFRQLYLFGADMGKKGKDGGLHHSKHAYHYTEGAKFTEQEYNIELPGNLGGVSYTSSGLHWAKACLEKAFRDFSRGRTYYNCSDGARFDFCLPMLTKSIKLSDIEGGKSVVMQNILELFPHYEREKLEEAWNDEEISKGINIYLDTVKNYFTNEVKSFRDGRYYKHLMRDFLNPATLNKNYGEEITFRRWLGFAQIFRGTFFMALIGGHYYLSRVMTPEKEVLFENAMREATFRMIEELREKAQERLGTLVEDMKKKRQAS